MSLIKYIILVTVVLVSNLANASLLDNFLQNSKSVSKYAKWIHTRHKEIDYGRALALSEEVVIEASNMGIRPNILLALIETESSFRLRVVSNKGAIGLTQVIPKYHADIMRGKKLTSYRDSIAVGAQVLAQYIEKHNGNVRKALKDYYGSRRQNGENYASKVLKLAYAVRIEKVFTD